MKNDDKIFKAVVALWALYVLLMLGLVGGIIYVAIHFLAKVW